MTPVYAQTATSESSVATANELQEITVTAQRRKESIEDVPISITALSGSQLGAAGLSSTDELAQVTPGLFWGRSTTVNQPTIRGIGSRDASSGNESNVANYMDGVYQPDQTTALQQLAGIDHIEILKGPQGTLFGRNATGGAINTVTRTPSFDWTGDLAASGGSFGYHQEIGYLSGPIISDQLAFGIAATNWGDSGYIRNVALATEQGTDRGEAARWKLLYKPSEAMTFQLNGFYMHSFDNVGDSGEPLYGSSAALKLINNPAFNPGQLPASIIAPTGQWTTSTAFVPGFTLDQYLVDAHADIDVGFATLSGLASYSDDPGSYLSNNSDSPLYQSYVFFDQHATYYNQEAVLTSKDNSMFTWLGGLSAFEARDSYDPLNIYTNLGNRVFFPFEITYGQNTQSVAAFGESTYQVFSQFFATAGLRYTWDKKESFNSTGAGTPFVKGAQSWYNTSPRLAVRYQFAENANVYASYSQGFKSGSYDSVTVPGAEYPAKPEIIKAYEVGLKYAAIPRLSLDVALFHYRYIDLQNELVTSAPHIAVATVLVNSPLAIINGGELDVAGVVADGLKLTGGLSLLSPKIKVFSNESDYVTAPDLTGNVQVVNQNVAGNDLIRSPRWTVNVGASYERPFYTGTIDAEVHAFFSARYWDNLLNTIQQRPYHVVDASVSWKNGDGHWTFTAFGKNLTNEYYQETFLASTYVDNATYAKPRWFGGTVAYHF